MTYTERLEKPSLKEWLLNKMRGENLFTGDTAAAKVVKGYWLFKEPQEYKKGQEREWCRMIMDR